MQKNPFTQALGRNLTNIRTLRGLTVENLADLLDVSIDAVYKYERGDRVMTIPFKYYAAEKIGCNPQEFEDGLDRLDDPDLLRKPMKITSDATHKNLRWLATEFDGDVDALVVFAVMVARWPLAKRRDFFLQATISNDEMLASGELDPADQPAGMAYMQRCIGDLYAAGEGRP